MIDFIDKTTEQSGTPINRENMMALQGFYEENVNITEDEQGNITIVETNDKNQTLTTNIITDENGMITIVEVFEGEKTITKTIIIDADGNILNGVLS